MSLYNEIIEHRKTAKRIEMKRVSQSKPRHSWLMRVFGYGFIASLLASLGMHALASTAPIMLSSIQANVGTTVTEVAKMLQDLSLIAGIGFIMASFFKFHQHKLNPTQVPMSQGVTLLAIGGGLTLFPLLIPTAGTTILGSKADVSHVSGAKISGLIGGSGSSVKSMSMS